MPAAMSVVPDDEVLMAAPMPCAVTWVPWVAVTAISPLLAVMVRSGSTDAVFVVTTQVTAIAAPMPTPLLPLPDWPLLAEVPWPAAELADGTLLAPLVLVFGLPLTVEVVVESAEAPEELLPTALA